MNTEIKYSGYTAQPSDYECPDGTLAVSLNLICEDGHIKPLPTPADARLTLQQNERILLVHEVADRKHYILARENPTSPTQSQILWLNAKNETNTDNATPITHVAPLLDTAVIGNVVALATTDGLRFLRWDETNYTLMSSVLPRISIDFGVMNELLHDEPFLPHLTVTLPGRTSFTPEEYKQYSTTILEFVNAEINKLQKDGLFCQPFFVRWAYRLYDGSHIGHSAPILMLPRVFPPLLKTYDTNQSDNTVGLTFYEAGTRLNYRILNHNLDELEKWAEIIDGIDIFVSSQIHTYSPLKENTVNVGSVPLGHHLNVNRVDYATNKNAETVFQGCYAPHADSISAKYANDLHSTTDPTTILGINRDNIRFFEDLSRAHTFYKVAHIPLKDIKPTNNLVPVKFLDQAFVSLLTNELLEDDFNSHRELIPSSLYAYNSRLNLANIKARPAEPLPLRSCAQFINPEGDGVGFNPIKTITVWSKHNGTICKRVHACSDTEADGFYWFASAFPRYIFYPDATAFKMALTTTNDETYTLDLTPHDFLNGAYYLDRLLNASPIPAQASPATAPAADTIHMPSSVYTSEINNPWIFPPSLATTAGHGQIYGICSAAKALSQGQFGQFPLYAFTSDGIWALDVSSTGTYSARQPISRDICLGPESITQIDSAVLFASNRGIMLLSGSQTQCISEPIHTDYPFSISSLPSLPRLLNMVGVSQPRSFQMAPFSEFLKECRMIYDYTHQRVIVFSPSRSYAYVYSMKSQQWMLSSSSNIRCSVSSYPQALALTHNGHLIDFSQPSTDYHKGLLVTRPLKLSEPNVHKTINTVIQRGNFQTGNVQTLLYGSRDIANWHLISSSQNHILRGLHGSPYKYFRLALLCALSPHESILGASLQFTPRLTNRQR